MGFITKNDILKSMTSTLAKYIHEKNIYHIILLCKGTCIIIVHDMPFSRHFKSYKKRLNSRCMSYNALKLMLLNILYVLDSFQMFLL
jgi:predicted membrane protein